MKLEETNKINVLKQEGYSLNEIDRKAILKECSKRQQPKRKYVLENNHIVTIWEYMHSTTEWKNRIFSDEKLFCFILFS